MDKSVRATCWSITINNPDEGEEEQIALAKQKGWKVEGQKEVGKEGTLHYQLLVRTPQLRFSSLKKAFPRGHIEIARNPVALQQYVHKEESRVGALPNTDKYVTSNKQLWCLVIDILESATIPKEHRICIGESYAYSMKFDALEAFDYAIRELIMQGLYGVESMGVNPQVRGSWLRYWSAMVVRRQKDRQSVSQPNNSSDGIIIPSEDEERTNGTEGEDDGEEGTEDLSQACGEGCTSDRKSDLE